jgi:hypothetical protein
VLRAGRGSIPGRARSFLSPQRPNWLWGPHLRPIGRGVKRPGREADELYLLPRSRLLDLYLYFLTRLHGVPLTQLSSINSVVVKVIPVHAMEALRVARG